MEMPKSGHNRPPTKNARPSKTEKERGRRWRMVHSGPFNGLCEIESSRGSPGISNIFLPMLQLLRTPSPRLRPPIPLVSLVVIPLPHIFLSRLPLIRLLSDEGGTPS